jgi:hypothetical protein
MLKIENGHIHAEMNVTIFLVLPTLNVKEQVI